MMLDGDILREMFATLSPEERAAFLENLKTWNPDQLVKIIEEKEQSEGA